MTADPYAPPTSVSTSPVRRKPASPAALAGASVTVVLLGIVLGWSIGWGLGAMRGEFVRPFWLELSEEKADIHAGVNRLVGATLGTLVGCGASVGLVGMFYWYRASVQRKLTKAPDRDAAP